MQGEELEKAVKRHERRRERFVKEGLTPDEAFDLAELMFDRDLENDDRRLCFECDNYNDRTTTCQVTLDNRGRAQVPLRFTLQRCPQFKLKEVK